MYFDYTYISFPGLGIEFNPIRYISIGEVKIYFYGLIIAMGLLLAVLYAWKRCKEFGIREDDLTDGVIWVVPFAIICARLYYCIFKWEDYASDPITILYLWKGGLAIYGGVIGAAIGVIIHCKVKKIKITALLDMVALGFLIGQCIGRWGNFFNREAFGQLQDQSSTFFLRMGLWDTSVGEYVFVHPTFLYESVWNLIGFVLLHFLSKKRKYDGQIALGYVAWYGLGRATIEGLRSDSLYLGVFRVSQLLAALSCFAAVVTLMVLSMRRHDPAKLYVHQVAARAAAEAAAAEAEESAEEEGTEEAVSEETDTEEEAPAAESDEAEETPVPEEE